MYAGFWRRVGAYLIDYALFMVAAIALGVGLGWSGFWSAQIEIACQLALVVGYWLYATGMQNVRDVIPFPRTPKHAEF